MKNKIEDVLWKLEKLENRFKNYCDNWPNFNEPITTADDELGEQENEILNLIDDISTDLKRIN